ncbi:MAG TPA: hypothetical protein VLT89_01220 [Usitatibacter sp.]|nr:hypothetical protein [Usitatibacter sp.]
MAKHTVHDGDLLELEQAIYARWLSFGVHVGFSALVVSFLVYLTRLLPPGVRPEDLPGYWGLPVAQYVKATGAPTGWSWLRRLGEGDLLNFVGFAILASTTLLCYLRMLPVFLGTRQRVLATICIAEIVVLVAAASGMVFPHP